ncbi:MAG: SDR family oxidoreductase [Gammaproteobacteria bacterium]
MQIADSRIIVTGGLSGLGSAFAATLAAAGARVWVLDNAIAQPVQSDIAVALPDAVERVHCDVGDETAVEAAVAAIDAAAGGIDVLVNNAAVLRDQVLVGKLGKRIKKHDTAAWHETLNTNLTGTFLMAREVAAAMIARRQGGVIVNISSISRKGNAGQSAYAASKAAVEALTVTWSKELAPYRIRVAAIAPGFIPTGMTQNIPPLFLSQLREQSPIRRFGTLDEFAHAIRFVIENDYFVGKTLELDGGIRF